MCDHPPFLRPFSPRHPSRVPGETEENTMLAVKPRVRGAHDSGYCPSPSGLPNPSKTTQRPYSTDIQQNRKGPIDKARSEGCKFKECWATLGR